MGNEESRPGKEQRFLEDSLVSFRDVLGTGGWNRLFIKKDCFLPPAMNVLFLSERVRDLNSGLLPNLNLITGRISVRGISR